MRRGAAGQVADGDSLRAFLNTNGTFAPAPGRISPSLRAFHVQGLGDVDGDGDRDVIGMVPEGPSLVVFDRHRHLHVDGPTSRGVPMEWHLSSRPGYATGNVNAGWVLATGRLASPIQLPGFGDVHFDPTTILGSLVVTIPASTGTASVAFVPPSVPALAGLTLVSQAIVLDPTIAAGARLTGFTEDRLR